MKHIIIITGGNVNTGFVREYIRTLSYDKVFAVDKGLEAIKELGIVPDVMIGDFDSVNVEVLKYYDRKIENRIINTLKIKYPTMKDDTDTELALEYAADNGADKITLIGATGTRMDHVLANIGMLIKLAGKGIDCDIVDETNRISILDSMSGNNEIFIDKSKQFGEYISLVPLKEIINEVIMEGVLYPLENASVSWGGSLTISNQIIEKTAHIRVGDGTALLIESKDK